MKRDHRKFTDIEYCNYAILDIVTTMFYNYVDNKERFLANILSIHNSLKDITMKHEHKMKDMNSCKGKGKKHMDEKEDKKLVKKMVKKDCRK
jgi:hypothetical protein